MIFKGTTSKYATLDKWFGRYIRLRDTNADGVGICISCGEPKMFNQIDPGHFISRRHLSIRWNTKNVNGQCRYCNRFNEGEQANYEAGLEAKYGQGTADLLRVIKHKTFRISPFEKKALQDHYRSLVKEEFNKKSDRFRVEFKGVIR